MRKFFDKIPASVCSLLTLCLILWFTLAPKPAGDVVVPLFEGADKVIHALMFGFLALVLYTDVYKLRRAAVRSVHIWLCAAASLAVGIIVEWLQQAMGLGRSMECADIVADGVGVVAAALSIVLFMRSKSRGRGSR